MGFNATRRYRDESRADRRLLIAGIVVVVVMVAWALGAF